MESMINIYQGIMLLLLYLTLIVRTIMLYLKDKINPFVLGKGKKGFDAILEFIFFIGLLIWSYEIIAIVFGLDFHIIPIKPAHAIIVDILILKYAGMLLILIGYIIFILSLIAFGKSWRVGIDNENPGKLATSGIFSKTRNPIFLYLDFYIMSTALINTNLFFITFSIIVIIGIHYQILQEEKFLQKHYENEYSEYTKRVRRYL
jgi:protein-S-isoprenylcysteine O-methyltransferase Ste14